MCVVTSGGGQRKRVNIGLELAARPTILMLDEPTSGLDASTALEIIRSVKRLTAIGAARAKRNDSMRRWEANTEGCTHVHMSPWKARSYSMLG